MNLQVTKAQAAYWLPKALEGQQGRVDSKVLQSLWQSIPKSSSKIRMLIKDLSSVMLTPKDSAIDKLAELVVDPSFLTRWLTQEKNPYPTLTRLVMLYLDVNEPALSFDGLKRIGLLVAHKADKSRYFPNPSKVPDLIEALGRSKLDKRYLSLFVWGMLTESLLAKSKFPGEQSLHEFDKAFTQELEKNGLDELLIGAYEADWKWGTPIRLGQQARETVSEINGQVIEKPKVIAPPTARRCAVGDQLTADVKALELKIDKYNLLSAGLLLKAKALESEDDPISTLRQIGEYSSQLEVLFVAIKREADELAYRVNDSIEVALQKLGIVFEDKEPIRFLIISSECWVNDVLHRINSNSELFVLLETFEDAGVVRQLFDENTVSAVSCKYEDLKNKLERLVDRYQCIVTGLAVENGFIGAIERNIHNLDWNVFRDSTLKLEAWEQLAEYYILTGDMSARLGIVVQRAFKSVASSFGDLLVLQVLGCDKSNVVACMHTLSWLTLAQQEHLAKIQPSLKMLVALSQLDAYFKALSLGVDYYIYWSASPLGEMSGSYSSLTVRGFFKSIYDIVSGMAPLNTKSLALCVSSAQIGSANAQSKQTSLDAFADELRQILTYRSKGGRSTYAHIWQAAYNDVFAPLLDSLSVQGVKGFVDTYEKWEPAFEIDNYIDAWKSEIPDHLKKNSEYDKFIRNQVSLKISEVGSWLNVYKSVTQKALIRKADPLADLKLAIGKVFKSSEQDCALIRSWLESKTIEQKNRPNNYVCQNREWTADTSCVANFKEVDALHPRAFAKIIDGPVTYEDIYTDDLVASFGYGTTTHLVELYAANEIFEGYALVANDSSEEISPVLDRRVEKQTEELASKLKQQMLALEGMKRHSSLSTVLSSAQDYIENQQWRLAAKKLSEAEYLANDITEKAKALEERTQLLSRIAKLGGHSEADPDVDNTKLNHILDRLLEVYQGRRVHINVLEKLLDLSSTEFEAQLADCLDYLDCLDRYPTAGASEQVAYYLEQAVDPIYSELSRSRTLLATYASQLRKLGKLLLLNIRHDQNLFDESSNLISMLVDTAEHWQRLSSEGKPGVDRILEVFIKRGIQESESTLDADQVIDGGPVSSYAQPIKEEKEEAEAGEVFEALVAKAKEIAASGDYRASSAEEDVVKLIHLKAWDAVSETSLVRLKDTQFTSPEELANWAVSAALASQVSFNIVELASVLRMINSKASSSVVRFLNQEKSTRPQVGDLVTRLIDDMASGVDVNYKRDRSCQALDALQALHINITSPFIHQESFRHCFEVGLFETVGLKAYWDRFAGDQKQAEARALFMYLAWKLHSTRALAYCLTLPPIDLERRKAEALARVAEDALVSGNSDLLQGFFDLKKSIQAKPFQIFADLVLSNSISHGENAARLTLLGGLERHADGTLRSVLRIEPRRVDSPDSITLKLPNNSPVRFANGTSTEKLNGPFFTGTSLPIVFKLLDEYAITFSVVLACSVVSLTGASSSFSQKVDFSILGDTAFEPLTPDEIDDAFDNFPDVHMRGEDYVPRIVDEQKIEKALFKSKTVRSIWISSPRRSGKTTMLYRILDAFSHKVNRDNLVVYLTLDEHFADSIAFNRWIWRRLRTFSPNRELRELYDDFEAIGRDLPFDSDTGTFIGELSDRLLSVREDGTRIIFLIDEVDRFAAMYFEGGLKKNTAVDILWQIRHMVNSRRDIGIVFAGSSAAKQVFITDAESPFYNSIDHLELTPFSCKSKAMEEVSRQIVEPHRVRFKYDLPKDSLEHLIWICAGIPYYMKLVAGATYATAKQSHILKADINEGLRALLGRNTGISKLDDMGGDPGSDDLRTTISIEKSTDGTLARAVLYSFADLHSPISGHKTYRGKISSAESRLVSNYNISRAQIERGLDICIRLGLIQIIETESVPEVEFVIPMLGESLRKSSGRLWANIDHELIVLSQEGK